MKLNHFLTKFTTIFLSGCLKKLLYMHYNTVLYEHYIIKGKESEKGPIDDMNMYYRYCVKLVVQGERKSPKRNFLKTINKDLNILNLTKNMIFYAV